jgi:hypothetical protein
MQSNVVIRDSPPKKLCRIDRGVANTFFQTTQIHHRKKVIQYTFAFIKITFHKLISYRHVS